MISSTKWKETECDPLFSIAVYKFFEQRNMRLRGSPDFAPGMNNFDTQLISVFFMLLNPVRLNSISKLGNFNLSRLKFETSPLCILVQGNTVICMLRDLRAVLGQIGMHNSAVMEESTEEGGSSIRDKH